MNKSKLLYCYIVKLLDKGTVWKQYGNIAIKQYNSAGFSILEIILAVAIFVTFATGSIIALLSGYNLNRLGAEKTIANQFNAEGMEAVRSIKNQAFTNLSTLASAYCTTGAGVNISGGGTWTFKASGTTDIFVHSTTDNFIRTIKICPVQRDSAGSLGDIVASGGVVDGNTMKATVTTTWNFSNSRPESVTLTSYFTNFRAKKGGMLVYGNGGTTTDAIQYQTYNATTDTWSAAASTADVDGATTNKALRSIRVYASSGRNEKIAISRHYNGSSQFIYTQVYNGNTGTWGNVQLLSSWAATTFLDVRNFDGTYLANGDFMVVYSDNTTTPKFRIWNGTSWSASSISMRVSGGIPNFIVVRARPGTNEVMVVLFDQASDTNSEYFNNSSGYVTASWTLHSEHSTSAPTNTKEFIDFNWNPNPPTKGALNYLSGSTDRRMNVKIFTANESGGGSWGSTANAGAQGTLGALNIDGRYGTDEFIACDKDANNDIYCFETNTTPSWTTPTNNIMTTNTQPGIERSFDVVYESVSGSTGIVVYSDNTAIPKLRKYSVNTNTFDAAATSLGALSGILNGVKLLPQPAGDDIMILSFDANRHIYTTVWDGVNSAVYGSGAKGFTVHGINGSVATEFWGNFAWDNF